MHIIGGPSPLKVPRELGCIVKHIQYISRYVLLNLPDTCLDMYPLFIYLYSGYVLIRISRVFVMYPISYTTPPWHMHAT